MKEWNEAISSKGTRMLKSRDQSSIWLIWNTFDKQRRLKQMSRYLCIRAPNRSILWMMTCDRLRRLRFPPLSLFSVKAEAIDCVVLQQSTYGKRGIDPAPVIYVCISSPLHGWPGGTYLSCGSSWDVVSVDNSAVRETCTAAVMKSTKWIFKTAEELFPSIY